MHLGNTNYKSGKKGPQNQEVLEYCNTVKSIIFVTFCTTFAASLFNLCSSSIFFFFHFRFLYFQFHFKVLSLKEMSAHFYLPTFAYYFLTILVFLCLFLCSLPIFSIFRLAFYGKEERNLFSLSPFKVSYLFLAFIHKN